MKLSKLMVKNYRSLRDTTLGLRDFTLFIGANASGKSAILDVLRFLSEAVQARDYRGPAFSRGGILNMAWKGQEAQQIDLTMVLEQDDKCFDWSVRLIRKAYDFVVEEQVRRHSPDSPPVELLNAEKGVGWWWSAEKKKGVQLKQPPTTCALAAASADASFPAREVAEFVGRWGFFDPNPFLLRRDWNLADSGRFDPYGRNLGETLYVLKNSSPEYFDKIVSATRSVLGLPSEIEVRDSEDRFYFVQQEPGLQYPVNQMGVSSGTLRMLALMTALYAQPEPTLIGIEEPENYIHPSALSSFVEHLQQTRGRIQFMLTTHSPLVLTIVNDPGAVNVVRRNDTNGTIVVKEDNPAGVKQALDASEFGLGEYHETRGFGA